MYANARGAVMKPEYLDELINRASKVAGSDAALARHLEQGRQAISNWRSGRTPCPPGDIALMAALAGLDAEAWNARAVISQYEGTTKGAKLEAALKKALLATGAVLLSGSVHAAVAIDNVSQAGTLLNTMYKKLS
jgi:hypothetical protein